MQELGRMIKKLCSKLFSRIVITGVLILIQAAWFWSLFTSLSSYAHWLNPLMIALSVIMCAVLIRQDSTAPEFKISWMVLFMIMPVQGGLLYLLWGDKRPAFRLRKKLDWAYDRIRPLRRTDPAAQAMLEAGQPPRGAHRSLPAGFCRLSGVFRHQRQVLRFGRSGLSRSAGSA